jgi:hypothetical protein
MSTSLYWAPFADESCPLRRGVWKRMRQMREREMFCAQCALLTARLSCWRPFGLLFSFAAP